jgi:hypothetical protein
LQTGVGGAEVGDITVLNNITWANANTLTLSAFNNININAAIANSSAGSLTLRADNTGTGTGNIIFTGSTSQITMSGGGAINFYYNPASFLTPTNFSSNVIVSGGTIFTPYMLVNNASELQNISSNLSGDYALSRNILLSGNFTPLGSEPTPFTGQFNGLNNTISNLSITATTPSDVGLFGAVSGGGTLENFILNNPSINVTTDLSGQSMYIGSAVGLNTGDTIQHVSVINPSITATGTNFGTNSSLNEYGLGGLVGAMFGGTISYSNSSGGAITDNVSVNTADSMDARNDIGGLVGGEHAASLIQNSFSTIAVNVNGNVTISGANSLGEAFTGGLVGRLDDNSTILNSYSTGVINVTNTLSVPSASGRGLVYTGGLIGVMSVANASSPTPTPNINNSYSTSAVTVNSTITNSPGTDSEVVTGGLFGESNGVVDHSYSTGAIVATLTSDPTSSGYAFYVGGLAGDSYSLITNSYSTSPITVTGTNNKGQFIIGGLVGAFTTLFDKEITESFSTGTINVDVNNINGGQLFVGGLAGNLIYYGNAPTLWPFANNYSISTLNVSGQNNSSISAIGGFIGSNGLDAADPGGNIINSYSSGVINNTVTTSNGGQTYTGGFIGFNIGSSATLNNNFWDTTNSKLNQNQGMGNVIGPVAGLIPGCVGGVCLYGGTADLSSLATYSMAGWDLINIWNIEAGITYPYFRYSSYLPMDAVQALPLTSTTTPIPSIVASNSGTNVAIANIITGAERSANSSITTYQPYQVSTISTPSPAAPGKNPNIEQSISNAESIVIENSWVNYGVKNIVINESEAQKINDILPALNVSPSEIRVQFLQTPNDFSAITAPGILGINFMVIALISILLLVMILIATLVVFFLRIQVTATHALANVLSKVNTDNYIRKTNNLGNVVAITNSRDIAQLLPKGLPEGYRIISIPTPNDTSVVCVLIGPLYTRAQFTATGT